ncbi:dynamin family protein [Rhodovulum tesquicola]|uniref:dynamin family protein n=1 Tax=Rhodovulum tesquicola TaxID=540254 RepID=UPI0020983AC1|nr:dynamin family protein [Rhodovulum tesquicola]MCO8146282.1 dynamin family protein [Rhodovulum tesquicola]
MTDPHPDDFAKIGAALAAMEPPPQPSPEPRHDPAPVPAKKPCIALMGEFSAGKSTLSNLLIGQNPLPVKVTATQLPPVRISHGSGQAWREDRDGAIHPLDIERMSDVSPADTRLVQLFAEADLLTLCDLIDMPGISDPNMDSSVWEGVIGQADGVIWCTHATQAWRQSEAAVWDELSDRLGKTSILLLTRCDKLLTEEDRARVLKRVRRETEGLFAASFPISLTEAVEGRTDPALWAASGAEAFGQCLVRLLQDMQTGVPGAAGTAAMPAAVSLSPPEAAPETERPEPDLSASEGVRPRRVTTGRAPARAGRPTDNDMHRFGLL